MGVAGVGGSGGLARSKSFFQKTLEAARGAFWRGLGGVRGGSVRRRCGVTPRPEDPHPRIASRAASNPLPQHEGERGGPFCGGEARGAGRGWQKGEGAQRERGQTWHEWEQSERGEAGGHRRRAEQDGEQAQNGRDQAQEAFERQEQEGLGGGHLGGVAGLTRIVYTIWGRMGRLDSRGLAGATSVARAAGIAGGGS